MRLLFSVFALGLSLIISGCESTGSRTNHNTSNDNIWRALPEKNPYQQQIDEVLYFIEQQNVAEAENRLKRITPDSSSNERVLYAYARAKLLIAQKQLDTAFKAINNPEIVKDLQATFPELRSNIILLSAAILSQQGLHAESARVIHESATVSTEEKNSMIWSKLGMASPESLASLERTIPEGEFREWIRLNRMTRDEKLSADDKAYWLDNWSTLHPEHPAQSMTINELASLKTMISHQKEVIAIFLPLSGKYAAIAEAIRDGVMQTYFNTAHKAELRFYNVDEHATFMKVYDQAIKEGADLVIGPLFKNQVEELYQRGQLPVRTLALNQVPLPAKPELLFEFSLAPEDEIRSLVEHISANGMHNALILAQADEFSQKNVLNFKAAWEMAGNHTIVKHSFTSTTELSAELEKPLNLDKSQMRISDMQALLGTSIDATPNSRTDIDSIIIFSRPESVADLNHWLSFYFADSVAIFTTSSIYRGYPQPEADKVLDGIFFTEIPLVLAQRSQLPAKYQSTPLIRLYAFGMDALRTTMELPAAIKQTTSFSGATGYIHLQGNQLERTLPIATFSQGEPKALPNTQTP